MRVLTGIVSFNPDIERLKDNLSTIYKQDTDILIYDNGSINISAIKALSSEYKFNLIASPNNKGIASGLKSIMDYANINHYDWVLSLDQDSIASINLINQYRHYIEDPEIGGITCRIKDRNFNDEKSKTNLSIEYVNLCITAGFFLRVTAYNKTTGYDEKMFIDCVDFDICYSLLEKGYKIIRIPFIGLLHEVGHGKNISLFGYPYVIYNHTPWRRYYINRNSIYIAKKHPKFYNGTMN
jgi:rhamnosyltransferase